MKWLFNSKKKTIIIIISFLIFIYFYNLIIVRPFPFFKVDYVKSLEKFNISPAIEEDNFYEIDLKKQNISKSLKEILDEYKNKNIYEKIKISTEITRNIQQNSIGKEIKSFKNIFSYENYFFEICSESAKIFISVLYYLNEKGRVIWTNGHTVAETWNGEKWIMTDTLSNVFALDKNNNYLSFSETVNLFPEVKFKSITERKYSLYDYKDDNTVLNRIIKNNNLIFLIPNKYVFSFHEIESKIERVLNSLNIKKIYYSRQLLLSKNHKKVGNVGIAIFKRFLN